MTGPTTTARRAGRARLPAALLAALLVPPGAGAQDEPALPPADPARALPSLDGAERTDAVFLVGAHTTVVVDATAVDTHPVATRLGDLLAGVTGREVPIELGDVGDDRFGKWALRLRPDRLDGFGPCGFRLRIEPEELRLVAATAQGMHHAVSAVAALLPADDVPRGGALREVRLPCLRVDDRPHHPARGLSLRAGEGARVGADALERLLPLLAAHRLDGLRLDGPRDAWPPDTTALERAASRVGVTLSFGPAADDVVTWPLPADAAWRPPVALPALPGADAPSPPGVEAVADLTGLDGAPSRAALDALLWPALASFAEAAWTGPAARSPLDDDRAAAHLGRLAARGVLRRVPPPVRVGDGPDVFAGTTTVRVERTGLRGHVELEAVPTPEGETGRPPPIADGPAPPGAGPGVARASTPPAAPPAVVRDGDTAVVRLAASATLRAVVVDGEARSEPLELSLRRVPALPASRDAPAPDALSPGVRWRAETTGADEPVARGRGELPLDRRAIAAPFDRLRVRTWVRVPTPGVHVVSTTGGGRTDLVLGEGDDARRTTDATGWEVVLSAGLHALDVTWTPAGPDDRLDLVVVPWPGGDDASPCALLAADGSPEAW